MTSMALRATVDFKPKLVKKQTSTSASACQGKSGKLKSREGVIINIACKREDLEDPFEKARLENDKIQLKLKEDKMRLIQFKRTVRERLKDYKHVENKIDEDTQLKINKTSKVSFANERRDYAKLSKFRSMSADLCLSETKKTSAKKINQMQSVNNSKVIDKNSKKLNFFIRTNYKLQLL